MTDLDPLRRVWLLPDGFLPHILQAVDDFLVAPTADQLDNWPGWREGWTNLLRSKLADLQSFTPHHADGPDDDPFAWTCYEDVWKWTERQIYQGQLRDTTQLLRRLRDAMPPPSPLTAVVVVDPRDGDGWEDAVARQGVTIPYTGYLQTTHWELLRAERITGQCDRCYKIGRTHLHHVSYERLGAERPEDTSELCADCHRREHPRSLKRAA